MKAFEIVALTLAGLGGAIIIGTAVFNMAKREPQKLPAAK